MVPCIGLLQSRLGAVLGSRNSWQAPQRRTLDALLAHFANLGTLTVAAFDLRLNADILRSSAELARTYGVEDHKILRTTGEVD